ncbi:MAG: hypothetical protein L0210_14540 [Rhodospirillales bacterium]|nr:hypothetical protein [Rhodospirillales bacterium]
MTDDPITLDEHRGMMAQKATKIRRHRSEFEADQAALRQRQEKLGSFLVAVPSTTWPEAAEKARYLLTLFAESADGRDPRRQKLIASVLDDFRRLSGESEESSSHE